MKNKIGLFILLSTTVIYAQTGADVGMSYLKIGVDARASAMGDAYTSLAEDAAATYWNPAGLANASSNSIILMHNHPSGRTQPSEADIKITQQLVKSGKILDIEVFDHLIVTSDNYFRFKENGLME